MKNEHQLMKTLPRTTSYRNHRRILPSPHHHSRSTSSLSTNEHSNNNNNNNNSLVVTPFSPSISFHRSAAAGISSLFRSLFSSISTPAARWLGINNPSSTAAAKEGTLAVVPSLGRKVTGTLFGHRRGHVSFAVQVDPRSQPVLLLELATSTSALVKEMASGLVRIALECNKGYRQGARGKTRAPRLINEPTWTMYCNGRRCGYAMSRTCGEYDWHVLSTVQTVSVCAGVFPGGGAADKGGGEGEVLYMRARFERVEGNRDSEAFYMLNPDRNDGPELSIFLLRV